MPESLTENSVAIASFTLIGILLRTLVEQGAISPEVRDRIIELSKQSNEKMQTKANSEAAFLIDELGKSTK